MKRSSHFPALVTVRAALVLVLIYHLAAPPRAAAYIDPLSGSIVLQVVVASVLGAVVGFRRAWSSVTAFIRRPFKRPVV